MKKTHLLCAAMMLAVSLPMAAQEQASRLPDLFVKTVFFSKVYTHELGYKVLFVNSKEEIGSLYVPLKWFKGSGGKGTMVQERSGEPPYFSIFWADGKFDHIVLHLPLDPLAPVWGRLETNEDLRSVFDIQEPTLTF